MNTEVGSFLESIEHDFIRVSKFETGKKRQIGLNVRFVLKRKPRLHSYGAVYTHDVTKIKGAANKNGLKNATCKQCLKGKCAIDNVIHPDAKKYY